MDARDTTTASSRDSASPGTAIFAVFVSFAEIYNEYIFDLLEKMPTSKGNKRNALMLGEDRNGAIYIKGEDLVVTVFRFLYFLFFWFSCFFDEEIESFMCGYGVYVSFVCMLSITQMLSSVTLNCMISTLKA